MATCLYCNSIASRSISKTVNLRQEKYSRIFGRKDGRNDEEYNRCQRAGYLALKKTILSALLFTLLSGQLISLIASEGSWLNTLEAELSHKFNSSIRKTQIEYVDHLEKKAYQATQFEGEGNLKEVANPFKTMTDFFVVGGWVEDWRYLADKHGGTSTAYRKGPYFCIASVDIDSSDDDESEGHIPSRYWISLVCREAKVVDP